MQRRDLVNHLDSLLQIDLINDYCPNGLQVEGNQTVQKVVTGVTASQALIDAAIAHHADTLIVHHGYFWKNEDPRVIGMKQQRLKALLSHNINLIAYHLPLDVHPSLGNNAQLGAILGLADLANLSPKPKGVVQMGTYELPLTLAQVAKRLDNHLNKNVLVEGDASRQISTIAWCTGGGQGYIDAAADAGVDCFISGEVSEQTIHIARERNISFIAAGHHATERYGVKALGEYIANEYSLDVTFIDIDNPA